LDLEADLGGSRLFVVRLTRSGKSGERKNGHVSAAKQD
jgi:hypothetical protein